MNWVSNCKGGFAALLRYVGRAMYVNDWTCLKAEGERLLARARRDPQLNHLQELYDALVCGEDRRFYAHSGVDGRAILRAIALFIRKQELQGASTITQQLVRRLTRNYARTFKRKFKEILLANLLDAEFPKREILQCYLLVAYFGWRMNGVHEALTRQCFALPLTSRQASQLIARLKYPEPQFASPALLARIERRAAHIERLMQSQREWRQ
jgi:membrane peptidoglycan carboxypeptidase